MYLRSHSQRSSGLQGRGGAPRGGDSTRARLKFGGRGGAQAPGFGPGSGGGRGSGKAAGPGSGRGSGKGKGTGSGSGSGSGPGKGTGSGPGPGPGPGTDPRPWSDPGSGFGRGGGHGSGHGPGSGSGRGARSGHLHAHPHGHAPWSRARRGDVRVAVLLVLSEEPMHGYQIMQQLEARSGGAWRPSPGSVYPTLQLLEDQGLIKGEEAGGRRVFALTEDGAAEAASVKERAGDSPWGTGGGEQDPRFALRQAVFQLGAAAKQVGKAGSPELVQSSLEILREARKRIYALLAEAE